MSYLLHKIPGRVRIKVPTIRYSPGGAPVVQDLLETLPGVEKAHCNPVTGSVVVYYDESVTSPDEFIAALKERGHLNAARVGGSDAQPLEGFTAAKAGQIVARALLNVALDAALKNTPFSLLTIFI